MKINNIGFIDSGIGGLTVLKNVIKVFPNFTYYYYADNRNNPYGEKTKEELLEITKNTVNYLAKKNCNLVVLACGTISSNIYDDLCKLYPNIIFIKSLTNVNNYLNDNNKVLYMATKRTCNSTYIKDLQQSHQNLHVLPCEKLASLIEKNNEQEIDDYLKTLLKPYIKETFDNLLLACTHYPLVKNQIKKYVNAKNIITPSNEVIESLERIINQKKDQKLNIIIYNSKEDISYTNRCYNILNQK